MQAPYSTCQMRKHLEDLGAVMPSRRAVAMIAEVVVENADGSTYWAQTVPDFRIRQAIAKAKKAWSERQDTHKAFREALLAA